MKSVQRFGVRGKLAPRYVGPYPIIERCGPVAYRVELPSHLSTVQNIFHVSQLKKCLRVPTRWLTWKVYSWSLILSIQSILSKLWTTRLGSLEIKPVISIRCNGAITPSGKLLRKRRNLFSPNVLSCSKHTNVCNFSTSFQFGTFILNLGTRFLFGERL